MTTSPLSPTVIVSNATGSNGSPILVSETFSPTTYSGFGSLTGTTLITTAVTQGSLVTSVPVTIGPSGVGYGIPSLSPGTPILPVPIPVPGGAGSGGGGGGGGSGGG